MPDEFTHSVYLHIHNSGVKFSVDKDPEFGPTIIIEARAFGHELHTMTLHVTKEALQKLAEMFAAASEEDYEGKTYTNAARFEEEHQEEA